MGPGRAGQGQGGDSGHETSWGNKGSWVLQCRRGGEPCFLGLKMRSGKRNQKQGAFVGVLEPTAIPGDPIKWTSPRAQRSPQGAPSSGRQVVRSLGGQSGGACPSPSLQGTPPIPAPQHSLPSQQPPAQAALGTRCPINRHYHKPQRHAGARTHPLSFHSASGSWGSPRPPGGLGSP